MPNQHSPDALNKIYIEASSRCNLNCKMCFRKTWINEDLGDMDLKVFENAMQNMPSTVKTVFFGGMGEPLVHKDIIYMVRYASALGKRVELITNATLLSSEMSNALLSAGIDMLWVSIDSFEEQLYKDIRKNSLLSLVKENLSLFNQNRKQLNKEVNLGLTFVVMKSNILQLEKIPIFIAHYKVSEVNISHVIPTSVETCSEVLYDKVVEWDLGVHIKQAALPKVNIPFMNWRQEGVMDGVKGLLSASMCNISISEQPLSRKTKYCRFVEENNVFIKHDGSVSPCMALLHSATTYWQNKKRTIFHHSFGNVKHQSLANIWHSEEYSNFRNRVKKFSFSPCFHCSSCDYWEENKIDCFGNEKPTCGACLWSEGLISCP